MTPDQKIAKLAEHLRATCGILAANGIGKSQRAAAYALLKRCKLGPHIAAARAEDDRRRAKFLPWRGEESKRRVRQ